MAFFAVIFRLNGGHQQPFEKVTFMNLHEYQAKELLKAYGVPVPP